MLNITIIYNLSNIVFFWKGFLFGSLLSNSVRAPAWVMRNIWSMLQITNPLLTNSDFSPSRHRLCSAESLGTKRTYKEKGVPKSLLFLSAVLHLKTIVFLSYFLLAFFISNFLILLLLFPFWGSLPLSSPLSHLVSSFIITSVVSYNPCSREGMSPRSTIRWCCWSIRDIGRPSEELSLPGNTWLDGASLS